MAIQATPKALGQVKAVGVIGVVVDLVMGAGQVADEVPGVGIGKVADSRAEVVDDVDAVENVKRPPRTIHVPSGAKSQTSVGIVPRGDRSSGVVRVVFGDKVFAREVVAQRPDDLGNGAGVDGLYGVEAKSVDTIVPQVHAGVVEKEVLNLALPGGEALPHGVW